ncbi:MAG TPA: ATP synthase F0 subunit B [Candidatus Binatia bacterium]|nr:ATP synthase F0 subunit B [Candidatus Binatia bacterium]
MISLDISILYQAILFVILWLILNKVLFQPYLKLLDERERKTTGAQHDSSELEHEGARLRAQYEEKIAQAQSAAAVERERVLQAARQEREKILAQARQEAEQTLTLRRREITTALETERRLAATEAATIGAEIASKVLGRNVA